MFTFKKKHMGDNSCVSGVTLAYNNRNHYRKILLRMASIHSIPASQSQYSFRKKSANWRVLLLGSKADF